LPAALPPALVRLRATEFRNFQTLDWCPPAGRLLLTGPNGAGKTSLLEAVYLAATTRSFRTAQLASRARRSSGGAPWTASRRRSPTTWPCCRSSPGAPPKRSS
jgi:DNA replication and repair protein RecF